MLSTEPVNSNDISSRFDNIPYTELASHTDIKPPYSIESSSKLNQHMPITMAMHRMRDVSIDWEALLPEDFVYEYDELDHLRVYLESSWPNVAIPEIDVSIYTFFASSMPKNYRPIYQKDPLNPRSEFIPVPDNALLFVMPHANYVRWDDPTFPDVQWQLKNGNIFYPTIGGQPLTEALPKEKQARKTVMEKITDIYSVNPFLFEPRFRSYRGNSNEYSLDAITKIPIHIQLPDPPYLEKLRNRISEIDFHPDLLLRRILDIPKPHSFLDAWGDQDTPEPNSAVISAEANQYSRIKPFGAQEEQKITKPSIVLKHGKFEEYFYLELKNDDELGEVLYKLQGLKGLTEYHKAWKDSIKAAHRVYPVGKEEQIQTEIKYLDMLPQQIQREFLRVKDRRDTLRILQNKLRKIINEEAKLTPELREIVDDFTEVSNELNKIERNIKLFVDRAKDLGYVLVVNENHKVMLKDSKGEDKEQTLQCGYMYVAFENYVAITETVNRRLADDPIPIVNRPQQPNQDELEHKGLGRLARRIGSTLGVSVGGAALGGMLGGVPGAILGGFMGQSRGRRAPPSYTRRKVIKYTDYELMNFHEAPHLVQYGKLVDEGKTVHLLTMVGEGYVSESGDSLETILMNLQLFPERKSNTVLFLPHHDGLLSGEKSLRGYYIIYRPQAGHKIAAPPTIAFEEKLSYRMKWLGVELGELLHSINLAPGESRTVTINRSYERRSETINEIISEGQISTEYSQEFTSSFEQTLNQEITTEKKSNWSANASGSYGGFSGGASGGGSSSKSVKDFSETVNRSAQKAASKVTTNNSQKVSSKSTNAITISSDESSVSTLVNINQGRSLNALFYSLYNIYEAHLYLDELKLIVDSGQELIAGTGITAKRVYSLEDLESALLFFFSDHYWFKHLGVRPEACAIQVIQKLLTYLREEYSITNADRSSKENSIFSYPFEANGAIEKRIQKLETKLAKVSNKSDTTEPESDTEEANKDVKRVLFSELEELDLYSELYTKFVTSWKQTKGPITSECLLRLPSAAIHQDAFLGVNRATEPYSERMREAEYLHRMEEVDNLAAETDKTQALAGSIRRGHRQLLATYPLAEPRIMQMVMTGTVATITLTNPLPEGRWIVESSDGTGTVDTTQIGKAQFVVTLNKAASSEKWVRLIEEYTGVYITEK